MENQAVAVAAMLDDTTRPSNNQTNELEISNKNLTQHVKELTEKLSVNRISFCNYIYRLQLNFN